MKADYKETAAWKHGTQKILREMRNEEKQS